MNTEQYKKELLKKLANQTISKSEYRQLELAALDDPFLFDALEGYYTAHKENSLQNLNAIDERIDTRLKKETKKYPFLWMIAASITLFVIAVGILRPDSNDVPFGKEIVVTQPKALENPVAESLKMKDSIPVFAVNQPGISHKQNKPRMTQKLPTKQKEHTTKFANNAEKIDMLTVEFDTLMTSPALSTAAAKMNENPVVRIAQTYPQNAKNDTAIKTYQEIPNDNTPIIISGKIVDQNGEGITGASVLSGESGAITDFDGNFSLKINPNDTIGTISYVGYNSLNFMIDPKQKEYILKMEESDRLLDEVVVTGIKAGRSKKRALTKSPDIDFQSKVTSDMKKILQKDKMTQYYEADYQIILESKQRIKDIIIPKSTDPKYNERLKEILKKNNELLKMLSPGNYTFKVICFEK